jgi:flagellar export protein FliJ
MQTRAFTLQPALSHKERCEDICQIQLAEIEAVYAREHRVLNLLLSLERLGYDELEKKHLVGKLDVGVIGLCFDDLHHLTRRIEKQRALLSELDDQVQRKREELIEIAKERRALEKLKEKFERERARAVRKAENAAMEEIAVVQSHRRRVEQGEDGSSVRRR